MQDSNNLKSFLNLRQEYVGVVWLKLLILERSRLGMSLMSLEYLNLNIHAHCPERDVFFGYEDPSVCCPQVVCGRSRPSDVVITAGQEVYCVIGSLISDGNKKQLYNRFFG